MKAGWEQSKLGEAFQTVTGNTPPKSKKEYFGSDVPLVKPPELADGPVSDAADGLTFAGAEVARVAPVGSVLVSCIGNLGKTGLTIRDLAFNQQINAILPESSKALPEFMFYQALSPQFKAQIEALSTGTTVSIVNKSRFNSITVTLPPLEEQQRIVAVLDEAFEGLARARAHAEANLQNARELFDSALRSVFSVEGAVWDQEVLPDVCIDFGRGKSRHRPRNEPTLYGGDFPFVQTGDIAQANHFITDFKQTYSDAGLAQSKLWPRNTVCVAIVGATIGESGILTFDACFPDSVIGMTADPDKADPEYIEFLLQFVKAELKEAGKGSARDNINLGTFSDRRFPVPPLAQQAKVVDRLNHLYQNSHDLVEEYTGKLASLDDLRQSLLRKAFAGELT